MQVGMSWGEVKEKQNTEEIHYFSLFYFMTTTQTICDCTTKNLPSLIYSQIWPLLLAYFIHSLEK